MWFFVEAWKIWTNMNVITENIYPDRDNFKIVSKPMLFKWFLVKLSRKITSSIYLFNISRRFTFIIHSNFAINLWKPFLCILAIPYQLVDLDQLDYHGLQAMWLSQTKYLQKRFSWEIKCILSWNKTNYNCNSGCSSNINWILNHSHLKCLAKMNRC